MKRCQQFKQVISLLLGIRPVIYLARKMAKNLLRTGKSVLKYGEHIIAVHEGQGHKVTISNRCSIG